MKDICLLPWSTSTLSVGRCRLLKWNIRDFDHSRKISKIKGSKHCLGLSIDLNGVSLDFRHGRNVIVFLFTFFFLEFERDAPNWALLNSPHEMSHKTGNLVPQSLCWDVSNFVAHLFVGLKIRGQSWIMFFNDVS